MFSYYLLNLVFYTGDEFEKNTYLIKSRKSITGSELYDLFIDAEFALNADKVQGYDDSGCNIDTFVRKLNENTSIAVIKLNGSQALSDTLQGYFEAKVYGKENCVYVEHFCTSPKTLIPATNFQLIKGFIKDFRPAHKGILTDNEVFQIESALYVKERSILDLRNLRDMVVMLIERVRDHNIHDPEVDYMDMISGITAVIDNRIYALGGEV